LRGRQLFLSYQILGNRIALSSESSLAKGISSAAGLAVVINIIDEYYT
jgi:hypothetical protein